jgi:hypothetical protein
VYYKFSNDVSNVIDTPGFEHKVEISGLWTDESKKIKQYKTFHLTSENADPIVIEQSNNSLLKESCLSGISIRERRMLMTAVRRLAKGSVVLETNSALGGRATIMSTANKDIQIYSVEYFQDNMLKEQFDSMEPWLENQMVDFSTNPKEVKPLLIEIQNSFDEDITGKKAWEIITAPYSNIKLFSDYALEDFEVIWDIPIDLCVIDIHENPRLRENLDVWIKHIKSEGLLMAHLYDRELGPDVVSEIDNLINQGWKLIRRIERLILIQKP